MSAFTGWLPSRWRATRPMRAAPAVWELDGPTMMGPIISKMFKKHSAFVKRVGVWGRPAPPRVRRTSVFDLDKSKTLAQSGIHFRCANKITGSPAALAAGAGPTIMGPIISKMFKGVFLQFKNSTKGDGGTPSPFSGCGKTLGVRSLAEFRHPQMTE